MKRTVRLRENELRRMIGETVKRTISEIEFHGIKDLHGTDAASWETVGGVRDDIADTIYDNWRNSIHSDDNEDISGELGDAFYKNINARNRDNRNAYDLMSDDDDVAGILRKGSNQARTISKDLGLYETIYKTVRNILKEGGMDYLDKQSQSISIQQADGTILNFKNKRSYDKWRKSQEKEKEKKKKKEKGMTVNTGDELDPNQLHAKIQKLVKSAAPLESLFTFKEHAYRSYGNIAREMMQPFAEEYRQFSIAYRKINQNLNKIQEYGQADEYETYNEARKLTYNIEDMQSALINLCNAVKDRKREIKMKYGQTFAYNGRVDKKNPNLKKELGFVDQLFSKSAKVITNTIGNLQSAAEEIASIADKGRNPLSYEINENRVNRIVSNTLKKYLH